MKKFIDSWELQIYFNHCKRRYSAEIHQKGFFAPESGERLKSYPIDDPIEQECVGDNFVKMLNLRDPVPKPGDVKLPQNLAEFENY